MRLTVRWLAATSLLLTACATTVRLPPPRSLESPEPRRDGEGRYVFPYTRDYALAEWCDVLVRANAFQDLGGGLGTAAGAAASSGMALWSAVLERVGRSIGRAAAIRSAGGWGAIRASSDLSFDDLDAYAVYLYQYFSAEETYPDALSAAVLLYPELEDRYVPAILEARR